MQRTRTVLAPVLVAVLAAAGPSRALAAAGGALAGALGGLGVSLGAVVAEARLADRYIESTRDLLTPALLPVPVGMVAGAAAGWSAPALLAAAAGGGAVGAVVGAAVGAPLAELLSAEAADRWAGGVVGGALGLLLGALAGVLRRRQRRGAAPAAVLLLLLPPLLGGCGAPPPPDAPPAPPALDSAGVATVLVLAGDPGKARWRHYPILPAMEATVEAWTRRPDPPEVAVVMLGDIVYPDGMHPPSDAGFAVDSARVADQIDVVRGLAARQGRAAMYFVAGNHDWGILQDQMGTDRLENLADFLERVRQRGADARLLPEAGTGGPAVVDLPGVRLVLLDTAWWLLDARTDRADDVARALEEALAGAGARAVVVAAHHPYASAGPHGGLVPVWKTLGIRFLLARSGALVQDLNSRRYRTLRTALEDAFARTRRPLLFAGGHEHSLQVIAHDGAEAPRFSLVSGSASKLTGVGGHEGMLFGRSAPGWAEVVVREDGSVDLRVHAAPPAFVACPEGGEGTVPWRRCMAEGTAAFAPAFGLRLREPRRAGTG